jgi:hypothetical protein
VEGVRLTDGPNGPPRPGHDVLPGEQVDLEFVVRGAGRGGGGEADLALAGEVVDRAGRPVRELTPTPVKAPPDRGGSAVTGTASVVLGHELPPGEYRVLGRLTDHVTGRVATFTCPLSVRRPEFGAVRLRLTLDKDGTSPAGCHLTVGQPFFVQMLVATFEHEGGHIRVSVRVSAVGRDGKDTAPTPAGLLPIDQKVEDGFTVFPFTPEPLKVGRPGEARVVVEVEDLIGKRKAAYELPVMVHPPRSLRAPGGERLRGRRPRVWDRRPTRAAGSGAGPVGPGPGV